MPFSSVYRKITNQLASWGVKPNYIIGLDSATAALRSLAQYLHGKDFPKGGVAPSLTALGINAVNHLPSRLIEIISTWSGWLDASSPRVLDDIRAETIAQWVVKQYPQRRYPVAAISTRCFSSAGRYSVLS
jgi:hypothetical protein